MQKRAGWGAGTWGGEPWGFDEIQTLPDVVPQPIGAGSHFSIAKFQAKVVRYSTARINTRTVRVSTRLP